MSSRETGIVPHSLVFCQDCGALLDPPLGTEDFVACFVCSGRVSCHCNFSSFFFQEKKIVVF